MAVGEDLHSNCLRRSRQISLLAPEHPTSGAPSDNRHVQFSLNRKWKIMFGPAARSLANKFYHFEVLCVCAEATARASFVRQTAEIMKPNAFIIRLFTSWMEVWSADSLTIAPNIIPLLFFSIKIYSPLKCWELWLGWRLEKGSTWVNCKGQKEVARKINKIKLLPQRFIFRPTHNEVLREIFILFITTKCAHAFATAVAWII